MDKKTMIRQGIFIATFLITFIVVIILLRLSNCKYDNRNLEERIIQAIEYDQKAVGCEVALYTKPVKFEENDRHNDWYKVEIINSEEEYHEYFIKVEDGKVVYCEEANWE